MNSEKVKEIKNNIIICSNKIECKGCSLFPNIKSTNCRNKLLADALTLINELESENEIIKFNMKETEKASFNINKMNGNLIVENQTLKDQIAELQEDKEKWQRKAVNYYQMAKSYGIECIVDNDIDETLKEYEND